MRLFNWIGNALSEDGTPSSKRLFGFMFVVTVCIVVMYQVFHSMRLDTYIYYPLLGMIALLAGVATLPQLIKLFRGGNSTENNNKGTSE